MVRNLIIRFFVFGVIGCFAISNAKAQRNLVDSLVDITNSNLPDTVKLKAYCLLMEQPLKDSSINYMNLFNQAIVLASKVNGKSYEAELYNKLGAQLRKHNKSNESLVAYQKSLEISTEIGNQKYIAFNHNNIANYYNNKGDYLKAISYYLYALKIFEQIEMPAKAASVMMSIGNIYADQRLPQKALVYYFKSLKIKRHIYDSNGIASNLVNIGSIYTDIKDYKKALAVFKQAKDIAEQIGFSRGIFVSLNNISEVYIKQGNYKDALTYQLKSLEMRKTDGELIDIALALIQLGNTYLKLNQPSLAKSYFDKAELINIKETSYENNAALCDGYARFYDIVGDANRANSYLKLFIQYKDSLYNENKHNQITDLETKYQTEKKDLEINEQALMIKNAELEIGKRKSQLQLMVITISTVLLLIYLFYYRNKLKQKALLDAELLHQQELRNKAIIEAEEKERIRIAKDLHDGVGQQLRAVKMHLSVLSEDNTLKIDKMNDSFNTLLTLVDEAVKEVRSVSHNMMPNALLTSGISAAFREFVNKISTAGSLKVDLQIIGLTERLNSSTETVLYRVLQECVSNIVKHAQASYISIQLVKHNNHLNMIIEDNGKGFDTKKINSFEGIGFKNIISRVQFLNGCVDFDSTIGSGTTINIEIPL
jgi:signal transduction histidine kinase